MHPACPGRSTNPLASPCVAGQLPHARDRINRALAPVPRKALVPENHVLLVASHEKTASRASAIPCLCFTTAFSAPRIRIGLVRCDDLPELITQRIRIPSDSAVLNAPAGGTDTCLRPRDHSSVNTSRRRPQFEPAPRVPAFPLIASSHRTPPGCAARCVSHANVSRPTGPAGQCGAPGPTVERGASANRSAVSSRQILPWVDWD
jgi:hypothetical protein